MPNFLLAIDGSDISNRVVDYVIAHANMYKEPVILHLLNVQLPMTGVNVKLFISRQDIDAYYQEEGMAALKVAREKLDAAGIEHTSHIEAGSPAEVLVQYAKQKGCQQIVMGTRGLGAVSKLILGSVATETIERSEIPILLIK